MHRPHLGLVRQVESNLLLPCCHVVVEDRTHVFQHNRALSNLQPFKHLFFTQRAISTAVSTSLSGSSPGEAFLLEDSPEASDLQKWTEDLRRWAQEVASRRGGTGGLGRHGGTGGAPFVASDRSWCGQSPAWSLRALGADGAV